MDINPKKELIMVSLLIPAYNEEQSIIDTIESAKLLFKNLKVKDFEIIVINDGSTDKTKEYASKTGVKIITHPQNLGYGFSLKNGIKNAKFQTIIITDADQTYPLDEVPKLYTEYKKGFDMVVGKRVGYKESIFKIILRKILKFVVEFAAGRRIPDINSGLRIFKKDTIKEYLPHLCETFSFTTSATLAYMMNGKFVSYVPINYGKRKGKSKVSLMRDSFKTIFYIMQTVTYYNPLKIFMLFSLVCVLFSLIGFLGSIFFNLNSGFLLGIGGLLVALITISIGLLADLLKQILSK
tara:strand:- start:1408 stop:2292 length:885 start_codon:yes stop_codon:yes gene_type:complete